MRACFISYRVRGTVLPEQERKNGQRNGKSLKHGKVEGDKLLANGKAKCRAKERRCLGRKE